ncbi:PilZ domain-containing protein [Anatilimnocola aggregata]|nr:PilZ domain-containing protein [Anatilimnocola aggregata]
MMTFQVEANRRQAVRHPASLVLIIQPVAGGHEAAGEPLHAVSLDLSQSGLRFCCDRPLLTDLAIVSIQAAEHELVVRLLAQRIRCRRNGPLFEIAVKFVEKLSTPLDLPTTDGATSSP